MNPLLAGGAGAVAGGLAGYGLGQVLGEWIALVLIVLVVLHLVWHWSYITANAKRWLRLPMRGNTSIRTAKGKVQ